MFCLPCEPEHRLFLSRAPTMAVTEKISDILQTTSAKSDPRTADWLMVPSPVPLLTITALYLAFVYYGPRWMACRSAFDLKPVILVYNFSLVLLSAWMVIEIAATSIFQPGFSWTCQRVDYSDDPTALRLANVIWWYYFSKVIEFMDTVFFILRKRNRQVTFLHVYHHTTMPLLWYVCIRYVAGGEAYFCSMVNSFIHVLMYTYYFMSALGPSVQKYLWWKRYITSLQLLQFNLIVIHTGISFYVNCGYPRVYMVMLILYCLSHILLFSNFFYQTYVIRKQKSEVNGCVKSTMKGHLRQKGE